MDCTCCFLYSWDFWKIVIPIIVPAILGYFLIKQYRENSQFTRISNMSSLWRKFYEKDENNFLNTFMAFEKDEVDKILPEEKMRFLAYLSEIIFFSAKNGTIDNEIAIRLFHWHFYYIYIDPKTKSLFWKDIGGQDQLESPSWKHHIEFAKECETFMKEKKIIA